MAYFSTHRSHPDRDWPAYAADMACSGGGRPDRYVLIWCVSIRNAVFSPANSHMRADVIPTEVGLLSNLRHLSIECNELTGECHILDAVCQ